MFKKKGNALFFSCESLRQYGHIYMKTDCAADWSYKVSDKEKAIKITKGKSARNDYSECRRYFRK